MQRSSLRLPAAPGSRSRLALCALSVMLLLSPVACSSGKQAAATATSSLAPNKSHAPQNCPHLPCVNLPTPVPYIHIATASNIQGDTTYLDNPLLNGNPSALVTVTPGPHPPALIGVWYDNRQQRWGIFREDSGAMPVGQMFSVNPIPGAIWALLQTVTASNSAINYTEIDSPYINNKPNLVLFVTPDYNPGGVGASWDNHPLGVIYLQDGHWAIYHRDGNIPMTPGATYNVQVDAGGANGWTIQPVNSNCGSCQYRIPVPFANNDGQYNYVLFAMQTVWYNQTWGAGGTGITNIQWYCIGACSSGVFEGPTYLVNAQGFPPNVLYNVYAYRITCPC